MSVSTKDALLEIYPHPLLALSKHSIIWLKLGRQALSLPNLNGFFSGLRDEKNVSKIGGLIQKACPRTGNHATLVSIGNEEK